jgi:hypothetical protein
MMSIVHVMFVLLGMAAICVVGTSLTLHCLSFSLLLLLHQYFFIYTILYLEQSTIIIHFVP